LGLKKIVIFKTENSPLRICKKAMMKNYNYPLAVLILLLSFSFAQAQSKKTSTQRAIYYAENVKAPLTQIEESKLKEVFADSYQAYILSNPARLKRYKNLLRNRIEILKLDKKRDQKECPLLSQVALFNFFNENLKRDVAFNKESFNPLKYNFNILNKGNILYRIDNTDYFILIKSKYNR